MKLVKRSTIEDRVKKTYGLGEPRWRMGDSSVWVMPPETGKVLKVTRLLPEDLVDHRTMETMGASFPHIARVFRVRPLCWTEFSTERWPWLYCLVIQQFMERHPGRDYTEPPSVWEVDGETWQQSDASFANHIAGVWVDVARVHRARPRGHWSL